MKSLIVDTITTTLTTTTNSSGHHDNGVSTPKYVGYICAVVAVVLYGSNFVPVKKYKTGDGMFFQWILCSGVFLSGLVLQMIHDTHMYILPMLGGAVWAIGNLCVVPVIKTIGMGLGLSIWGTCALFVGWAIGRFGLFGTAKAEIGNDLMNDFSVVLAFLSIVILLMVKNNVSSSDMEIVIREDDDKSPLISQEQSVNSSGHHSQYSNSNERVLVFKSRDGKEVSGQLQDEEDEDEETFIDRLSPNKKRFIGSVLSILSGLMYGVNFTPTLYVQHNYHGASQHGLDYVFSQFCGIYLASSTFFVLYALGRKNRPKVYPKVIVPGLISGIMWAVATACWNVSNSVLSQAISFPIVATGPCGLASLFWGVLIFREIKGAKNIAILLLGFSINLTGAVLAGLSTT